MLDKLTRHKKKIDEYSLDLMSQIFGGVLGEWSDVWKKSVLEMVPRGKGVRGGLLVESALLLNVDLKLAEVVPVASALELVGTALLIQDDVMDGDKLRRGMKTLHIKLAEDFSDLKMRRAERLGESVAHCMADVIFFGVFGSLSATTIPNKERVVVEFGRGFVEVGFGQARDLEMAEGDGYSVHDILEMYSLKTASYTTCLPLKLGALVAGADKSVVLKLGEIGRVLGVMFQISDDMLNVFGDFRVTGKSLGSDIAENKHTILKALILSKAVSDGRCAELATFFGNPIDGEGLEKFRGMARETGVLGDVEAMIGEYRGVLDKLLSESGFSDDLVLMLKQLGDYVGKREK